MTNTNALLVVLLAAILGRFITLPKSMAAATRVLAFPAAPVVFGVITAVFMAWLFGGLDQVATVHDEAAYLLQARIYASGHWVAPGLPLPQFFEQYHVFVTPILTPKYPPGHALLLAPGIWLGLPGLVPVLLVGLCGALTFALARRLANPWVGFFTWLFWLTSIGILDFLPTYLSETTTSALWMLGWFALVRWLEDDRPKWLNLLAFAIGLGFLTRPVTMVVFALPVAVVVLVRIARRKEWRELVQPFGVGFVFLGIWCLWCQRTTGSPLRAPYGLYSRYYFPDDVMGFGLTGLQPLRHLNPDMALFNEYVQLLHKDYTLANLPSQLWQRLVAIAANMWATRALFLPLAVLGLITTSRAVWLAVGTAALLVSAYLCVGHGATWTVYYVEFVPVLAFASVLGWWRLTSVIANKPLAWPLANIPETTPNTVFAMIVGGLLLMPYTTRAAPYIAGKKDERRAYQSDFRSMLRLIPDEHSMVFIRYSHTHSPHQSLVTNAPDLAKARVWTVYDLGADNVRLMRLDPTRKPYLFDEDQRILVPLDSTGAPHSEHVIHEPGERF
ncbi:MAG TPA: glycosyltransferase family 39 protein [Gemmatimonadaceae bacterium]|jgi:4-amino-4-deoxy-L-arabinose transferase-like glycosyltransferase|nr:glycosyltransferase family 39 protein [Gemmatimonadaceae bacterium]